MHNRNRYTFGKFVTDAILTVLTQGIWLIWVIIREIRNRPAYDHYYQGERSHRPSRGCCNH